MGVHAFPDENPTIDLNNIAEIKTDESLKYIIEWKSYDFNSSKKESFISKIENILCKIGGDKVKFLRNKNTDICFNHNLNETFFLTNYDESAKLIFHMYRGKLRLSLLSESENYLMDRNNKNSDIFIINTDFRTEEIEEFINNDNPMLGTNFIRLLQNFVLVSLKV